MVYALRAAHERLRPGGLVIDARPDRSRRPRIVARGRVRGRIVQCTDADDRDARADEAVDRVVARGLFRRTGEGGAIWHSTRFADLDELDGYLRDSARYCAYERGTRAALLPFRRGPITMRRAIKFEVLERRRSRAASLAWSPWRDRASSTATSIGSRSPRARRA